MLPTDRNWEIGVGLAEEDPPEPIPVLPTSRAAACCRHYPLPITQSRSSRFCISCLPHDYLIHLRR
ncbi:hypothetical protein BDV06DRAFT_184156 [Aspergillus oleicola]